MCNAQWPKWYYRVDEKDVYPYACVCESCMLEMISQNDEDEEKTDQDREEVNMNTGIDGWDY
jgi:hypothetical protein